MAAKVVPVVAAFMADKDQLSPEFSPAPADGMNGWSPILAGEQDATRTLLKVVNWSGGTGPKPAINVYIGTSGYVATKAEAFNFNAIKRVTSMSGTTDAQGVATFDFTGFNPKFADKPQVIVSSIFTNVVAVLCRVKSIVASKDNATITVEQVGVVGGVVALAAGASITVIVIEA